MRSLRLVTCVGLAGVLLSSSCATRRPMTGQEAGGLDRKYSTFAYIEEGKLVDFIVDTRATRLRDEDRYIPLEFLVGNRGLKTLTLSRESFVLVDSAGRRYQAANPRELLENYEFLDWDRTLAELLGIAGTRYAAFTQYPSNFSPLREASPGRSNLVRDFVSVPKFGFIVDYIYFPRPEGGVLDQEFELFLQAPELQDPVFVKFKVL